ncbi:MAG: hypothetical protein KDA77_13240, partial [Planctomycetaceae bacterium]|nr:hypothetical protein [Planctomycetaceae bacterium]
LGDPYKSELPRITGSGKPYEFEYKPDGGGPDASRPEQDVPAQQKPAPQQEKPKPAPQPEQQSQEPPLSQETQPQDRPPNDPKQKQDRPEQDDYPSKEPSFEPRGGNGEHPVPVDQGDGGELGVSDIGHTILDFLGMVPLLGEPVDMINAGWYAIEGDMFNASLSMAAAIPGIGNLATGGKLAAKAAKAAKLGDTIKDISKVKSQANRLKRQFQSNQKGRNIFKKMSSRKKAKDATGKLPPQKKGEPRRTRQTMRKARVGSKSERHNLDQSKHFHDKIIKDGQDNVHYQFPDRF